MRVSEVEISEVVFDPHSQAHMAQVILRLCDDTGAVVSAGYYYARTEAEQDAPKGALRHALVADALRQARRMPEYRNGARQLHYDADSAPMVA